MEAFYVSPDGERFDSHADLLAHLATRADPVRSVDDQLAAIDPAALARLAVLANHLIGNADTLAAQVSGIAGSSTSKAPLTTIAAAVTAAAKESLP